MQFWSFTKSRFWGKKHVVCRNVSQKNIITYLFTAQTVEEPIIDDASVIKVGFVMRMIVGWSIL